MRSNFHKLIALCAVSSVVADDWPLESFKDRCNVGDIEWYGEDTIGLYCKVAGAVDYFYQYTTIALGLCIGNQDGKLVKRDNGTYEGSCSKCSLTAADGTSYLGCKCKDDSGQKQDASFDLNDVLQNKNGALVCFNHEGTRSDKKPGDHPPY